MKGRPENANRALCRSPRGARPSRGHTFFGCGRASGILFGRCGDPISPHGGTDVAAHELAGARSGLACSRLKQREPSSSRIPSSVPPSGWITALCSLRRSVLRLSRPEGGPGGYVLLVAERRSVREGEAGSEATVGRGKAERIPPPSRGSPRPRGQRCSSVAAVIPGAFEGAGLGGSRTRRGPLRIRCERAPYPFPKGRSTPVAPQGRPVSELRRISSGPSSHPARSRPAAAPARVG